MLGPVHLVAMLKLLKVEFVVYAVILILTVLWCHDKWKRRHFERVAAKMKGPSAYPIIGTGLQFLGTPQRE